MLLLVGAVLVASIVVALGASRTGVPTLVAFLALGMLLGSDGPGGVDFSDEELARAVGVVCLAAILFEGGLSTLWRRLRQVVVPAALLSTIGVAVTAVLTGAAAYVLFDLTRLEAVLLGAVVSSTDAAAVFATLRYTNISRRLARTLEAETGGNDPMAIALTIGLIAWIQNRTYGFPDLALEVVRELGLGLLVAVSLVGLAVGSTPSRYRRQLVAFHEGLAFLAQVAMFVVLGLLVFPHDLPSVALPGVALAALLVLLIRPAAVWTSTAFSDFTNHERALLGWAGLRGAVPIVLGTIVLSSGIDSGETIFNAVFFVVVVSALLQGTTLEWVARRLRLVTPGPAVVAAPIEVDALGSLELVDFAVAPDHAIAGAAVRELGLPRSALVAVVARHGATIPPRGSTVIQPGDRLFVLAPRSMRPALEDVFGRWRRRV